MWTSLLLLLVCLTYAEHIVVIGAGIGGSCLTYYLEKFGHEAQVSIIEASDYVGGRLKHIVLDGQTIELGGDAWASVNTYIQELVQDLNIPVGDDDARTHKSAPLGIWTGSGFVDLASLLARNVVSEARIAAQIAGFDKKLKQNYEQRASEPPFASIAAFLRAGELDTYTQVSAIEHLTQVKVAEEMCRLGIEPVNLDIYDQGLDEAHAFATLVALSAAQGAASAKYGNSKIPEACLNYSKADLYLNTRVTTLTRVKNQYKITTARTPGASASSASATESSASEPAWSDEILVDKVVLAAPFEYLGIDFTNMSLPDMTDRQYRHWYVTFALAEAVDPSYFGLAAAQEVPASIMTTKNASTSWTKIDTYTTLSNGTVVFKMFSNVDISNELPRIFQGMCGSIVHHWKYTFPTLSPTPAPRMWRGRGCSGGVSAPAAG